MAKEHSVKKNYIYNLLYQAMIIFFPLVTMPHVARALGPNGVGTYSYVLSIVSYFVLCCNLGISSYGQIHSSKLRDSEEKLTQFFYEVSIARLFVFVLVSGCYFLFIRFIAEIEYKKLYLILFIQLFVSLFDFIWFLQGLEEFRAVCVRKLFAKALETILIFLFVNSPQDIEVYLIIIAGCELLGNIFLGIILFRLIAHVKLRLEICNILSHIFNMLIYFIPTIATSVYLTIDKSMLGWFTNGKIENGYYEQAQKIAQMATNIVTGVSVVTMPRMAYLLDNDRYIEFQNQFKKSLEFVLFLACPMCVGLMGVSKYLVPLFLGDGYEKSIGLLSMFSILLIVIGLNNAIGKQVLMASGRQKEYNKSVIFGAIINVILNLLLIPQYLSYGAAISSIMAELVVLIAFIYYSREKINLSWIFNCSGHYIVGSVIMLVVVQLSYLFLRLTWKSLLIQVLLGISVYVVALLFLKNKMLIYCFDSLLAIIRDKNGK